LNFIISVHEHEQLLFFVVDGRLRRPSTILLIFASRIQTTPPGWGGVV
jgi:hypothetical protein